MPKTRIDLTINGRFMSQSMTGVQRVARELTREIDLLLLEGDERFQIRLACQPHAPTADMNLKAIQVETIGGPRGWLWEQMALPRAARDGGLLCLGNTAPLLALLRGQRVGLMIHDLSYRKFPAAYRKRYRAFHALILPTLLKRADPIFTVSKTEEAVLRSIAPTSAAKIVVAQNGGWRHQAGYARREAGEADLPRNYATYVGSLSLRKNFAGLIELAVRLAREDDIDFVFVGTTGRILKPHEFAIPPDVQHRIHFLGQIEDLEHLGAIYRQARCLLFPSFYEASAIPPLEAMHFGCPVVTSNIPSMVERCGEAAEYCNPRDTESVLAAARRVLYDPARAAELVRLGHERQMRFSWRTQAKILLDAIQEAYVGEA